MKMHRRNFIQTLGITALALGFLNPVKDVFGQKGNILGSLEGGLFPIPPESLNDPLTYLTSRHFEPFVNTVVRVKKSESRTIELELIEVKQLNHEVNDKRGFYGESFSLLFQNAGKTKLPQGTYEIEHDALGRFSLFLVPTGLRGIRYEAIINHVSR